MCARSQLLFTRIFRRPIVSMSAPASWATIAQKGVRTSAPTPHAEQMPSPKVIEAEEPSPHERSTSPSHIPRTDAPEDEVYVLSFLTSEALHNSMTDLRQRYFPPQLNRLDAHLTLFHALPGSKLESEIVPVLKDTAESTHSFQLLAATPFRLRKGVAIGVPKSSGGDDAKAIHAQLKARWLNFLSKQDAGGFAAHYTIMNKVDKDEDVDRALAEVQSDWQPRSGVVRGLSLWRYERSRWNWQRDFFFVDKSDSKP